MIVQHALITGEYNEQYQEFGLNALLKPLTKFIDLFRCSTQVMHHFLPIICHEKNISQKLILLLAKYIGRDFNPCHKHNITKLFFNYFIDIFCYNWARTINRILTSNIRQNINDPIKYKVFKMSQKYRSSRRQIKHIQ